MLTALLLGHIIVRNYLILDLTGIISKSGFCYSLEDSYIMHIMQLNKSERNPTSSLKGPAMGVFLKKKKKN